LNDGESGSALPIADLKEFAIAFAVVQSCAALETGAAGAALADAPAGFCFTGTDEEDADDLRFVPRTLPFREIDESKTLLVTAAITIAVTKTTERERTFISTMIAKSYRRRNRSSQTAAGISSCTRVEKE
jgi:hypothetical protein